jgi:hypothetical protein
VSSHRFGGFSRGPKNLLDMRDLQSFLYFCQLSNPLNLLLAVLRFTAVFWLHRLAICLPFHFLSGFRLHLLRLVFAFHPRHAAARISFVCRINSRSGRVNRMGRGGWFGSLDRIELR